ncbi:sulfatase-like hydrolase/transferase [Streptomyces sp. NBC_01571]|uniref:sulfatase-like hydrolase/transferase n=1 Tax=Streptomyces sp. NBC_01571 TaxID=2975883 RepID=UPI0022532177|nr:sulfatase-like hydrolase/transferase [Streptomyces sp. NBC_01571]MCX4577041.1 sulfatase-like hydrolase/transferase [Streptomyces sp. NBC_01571]
MSFNTSSRQLPDTDETPEEARPREIRTPDAAAERTTDAPAGPEAPRSAARAKAAGPTGPAETADAAEADAPGDSSAATEPDARSAATEPDESPEPAKATAATDSPEGAASAEADETTDSPEGADTTARTDSPEPAEGAEPAAAAESARSAEPAASAETATPAEPGDEVAPGPAPVKGRWRGWRAKYPVAARALTWTTTGLAAVLVLFALLMPNSSAGFRPGEFVRIPVEAIFGAAVLIVLPRRPRVVVAAVGGLVLGVLTILNLLDIGFNEYLGRGFNLVLDWSLFADARAYLQDTMGKQATLGIVVALVLFVIVLLAVMSLAVVRLAGLMSRHTVTATRSTLVLGTVWIACAALGVQFTGVPVASDRTAKSVEDRTKRVQATLRDEAAFAKFAKKDAFANTPPDQLLTDLRGKDMMITFIESYGRSAIEDPVMAPGVDATLTAENQKLVKAGFAAKSGWLTSATYGGSSWLGHSTFLSGLWISNQQRYRTVTAGEHLTLTKAFKKSGGWDTVGVMPGVQKAWPESKFYGLDKVYDSHKLDYKGPKFSWSTMPDQYALTAFERLVHGKKHDKPLMSEIILTSSHQPWAPIPKLVPQDQVGDGSVYNAIEKAGKKPADIITDSTKSKQEYGKSIQYSVSSLINYLVKYGNKNTVLIFLGDHQPIARVSGNHASRDVPVSIVAKDPKVLDKIADWGWTDGLRPEHNAPVWKMSSFRDRFMTAYGSTPAP